MAAVHKQRAALPAGGDRQRWPWPAWQHSPAARPAAHARGRQHSITRCRAATSCRGGTHVFEAGGRKVEHEHVFVVHRGAEAVVCAARCQELLSHRAQAAARGWHGRLRPRGKDASAARQQARLAGWRAGLGRSERAGRGGAQGAHRCLAGGRSALGQDGGQLLEEDAAQLAQLGSLLRGQVHSAQHGRHALVRGACVGGRVHLRARGRAGAGAGGQSGTGQL